MENKIYHYIGPIKRFGKIVAREWEGETTAPSLPKGVNNLKFKAKKYLGLVGNAQVELVRENIEEIDGLDYEEEKEYNRSYDPDYDIPDEWEGSYEDSNLKLRDEEGTYDVCWEDTTTHKRGRFRNRTESQIERLERNRNLRIISISPSEDENKQYSIDFYYNIYYVDIDNTYEEEKKALKEDYLPRYNLKLIEFAEIHDGGPDNCRITLKGTKSDLEKFIYDMDENPEDYKFKARDTKFKDVEPRKGEDKQHFISRFMRETKSEYPDYKQRLAVAYSYWKRAKED